MHSTDVLDDGYLGSGKIILNSIAKHGKAAHVREVLANFETRAEMKAHERKLITEEMLNDPLCMNLKAGGEGGWEFINENGLGLRTGASLSAETKAKIGLAHRGMKKHTSAFLQRMTTDDNPMKRSTAVEKVVTALSGQGKSEEHKKKIADAIKLWHQQRKAGVIQR